MSIKIMNSVWSSHLPCSVPKNKRSTVKIVLLKLADNANDNGKCWPSIPRIAHETELSERSVIRALDNLKESNLIQVKTHRKNGVKHNTYYINTPLIDSLRSDFESSKPDENDNPFTKPSDTLSKPSDTLSKINDRVAVKPSRTINKPSSNTDIFSGKQKETYFIHSLDKEDFKHCHEAMERMEPWSNVYTGSITLDEWEGCEEAMRSVDFFDFDYIDWWLETRSQSMRKNPSLPNMLCEVNGIPFDQFYDQVFLQR